MTEKEYIQAHSLYERKVYRLIMKEFRGIARRINYKDLNESTAPIIIRMAVDRESFNKTFLKIYLLVGGYFGRVQMQEMARYEKEVKRRRLDSYPLFSRAWQQWVLAYLTNFGGENITLLTDTYIAAVISEIKKAQIEVTTIDELADLIQKRVNSPRFYRWQAMRIARTETSKMVNASQYVATDEGIIVMEKVWYHYRSPNERESHIAMNGKTVGKLEAFEVDGERMLYPTDSSLGASAGSIVNCRCRSTYRPKRDANGRLILKS